MKWGKVYYQDLIDLQERLNEYMNIGQDKFISDCAKELAARLIAKVQYRTPVDTGNLRANWTGGELRNAKEYARSLPVEEHGDIYTVVVYNPTRYASFVEFGHRDVTHSRWIKGRFFLTKSEIELEAEMPRILEQKIAERLGELFAK